MMDCEISKPIVRGKKGETVVNLSSVEISQMMVNVK